VSDSLRTAPSPSFPVSTTRGFDQLPELRVILKCCVLSRRQTGSEQKILQRVLAKDSINNESKLVSLEVNTVIAKPKAVKDLAISFKLPKSLELGCQYLVRQSSEFTQDE